MTTPMSIKEAERKAWRSVFQDGLWDIYLGMLLLAMGIGDYLDTIKLSGAGYYATYFGIIALGMLVLWAGKRYITLPRLGKVKFGQTGKIRRKKTRLLLFASVGIGIILWFLADAVFSGKFGDRQLWDVIFPLAYVLNMLLAFGLAAYFLDFPRLYIVAVCYAIPVPLRIMIQQCTGSRPVFYHFAVPAFIILVMGLVCLVRFVNDHPQENAPGLEVNHGS